jgi:hypothetical protein
MRPLQFIGCGWGETMEARGAPIVLMLVAGRDTHPSTATQLIRL